MVYIAFDKLVACIMGTWIYYYPDTGEFLPAPARGKHLVQVNHTTGESTFYSSKDLSDLDIFEDTTYIATCGKVNE